MRIILNPDSEKVKEIKELVQKNDGYCPCAVVKCKDTKCINGARSMRHLMLCWMMT